MAAKNPLPKEYYYRRREYRKEDIRGAFFRDQTAIIHSTAFRRLKHKTQVFYAPKNDHICTRIEHVLHVATIAKTICKGLNLYGWELDVEMAFAIGLGHDLGHAPFGHDGEVILSNLMGGKGRFIHEIHSYRVVEYLANHGRGLNLTYGVKDGIITHNGERYEQFLKPTEKPNDLDAIINRRVVPSSYEGCVVRFADKIAYIGRDIEDAITVGIIKRSDIPIQVKKHLGETNSQIINTLVNDIIETSKDGDKIGFSNDVYELLLMLKRFNYQNIYLNDKDFVFPYVEKTLKILFDFLGETFEKYQWNFEKYENNKLKIVKDFGHYLKHMQYFYNSDTQIVRILGDFIAGMTDDYAIDAINQIVIPKSVI